MYLVKLNKLIWHGLVKSKYIRLNCEGAESDATPVDQGEGFERSED